MKKLTIISIIALFVSVVSANGQTYPEEYLGLPGDNLNLYATMKLFQESETLEGFERSLNDQKSNINNLDLNGDNMVDYIMVTDYLDDNVHNIVLRTALNNVETQDIAVFTVERFDDGSARIQLIGDEALYGKNYIVEPIYADSRETPNPGYLGNSRVIETPTVVAVTTYEVAAWPIIRFIFRPAYTCWHSLWSWDYYPSYWNPWRPYYWHTYYGYHTHFHNYYYGHYHHWNHYRYNRYNNFYYSHVRTYSPRVSYGIRAGNYQSTYSRPDLRKRGDELYSRTARRSTTSGVTKSESESRISGSQSANNRSIRGTSSNSGRKSVANNSSRTQANGSLNRRAGETKSAVTQSGRSTINAQASKRAISQRPESRGNTSYRSAAVSSASRNKEMPLKSATFKNTRSSGSSSVRQNSGQSMRSPANYSKKSSSTPKVSTRSSRSESTPQARMSANSNRSSSKSTKSASSSSRSGSSSSGRSGRR